MPSLAPRRLAQRPHAVIFDMDGVLLDTESLGERTWAAAASSTGVEFDLALLPLMIGRNYRDCRAFLLQHYGDGYPVERLTTSCLAAFDAIVAREGIALKSGVIEILDWLAARGIPCAVATSTRRERAQAQLTQQRIYSRFATLVGGDEVAHASPRPIFFSQRPRDCRGRSSIASCWRIPNQAYAPPSPPASRPSWCPIFTRHRQHSARPICSC